MIYNVSIGNIFRERTTKAYLDNILTCKYLVSLGIDVSSICDNLHTNVVSRYADGDSTTSYSGTNPGRTQYLNACERSLELLKPYICQLICDGGGLVDSVEFKYGEDEIHSRLVYNANTSTFEVHKSSNKNHEKLIQRIDTCVDFLINRDVYDKSIKLLTERGMDTGRLYSYSKVVYSLNNEELLYLGMDFGSEVRRCSDRDVCLFTECLTGTVKLIKTITDVFKEVQNG